LLLLAIYRKSFTYSKKAGVPFIFAEYGLGDVKEDYPTIHSFSELKNILRKLD